MDNSEKFLELRKKYKNFSYNSFQISETDEEINIEYEFEIENLCKFNPTIKLLKKNMKIKDM